MRSISCFFSLFGGSRAGPRALGCFRLAQCGATSFLTFRALLPQRPKGVVIPACLRRERSRPIFSFFFVPTKKLAGAAEESALRLSLGLWVAYPLPLQSTISSCTNLTSTNSVF